MFVVTRLMTDYGHPMGEVLELHCHTCGRRFTALTQAYLGYEPPAAGARSEARWGHRRCLEAAGEGVLRLVRADFELQRLLTALVTPALPRVALHDRARTDGRQTWGQA